MTRRWRCAWGAGPAGLLAAACLLFAPLVLAAQQATSDPHFDWFSYQGRDSIFETVKAGPNEYLNPILEGFYPDPSIERVGDDYYLVNSSFSFYPGVPIWHSRDLVHWTQIGNVLDRPSQLSLDSLGISRGVFAPAIRYHDGVYYMINTLVDAGGNYYVTATDPAGPWSDPVWLRRIDGIDPSFFFDDDGKAYILNNGPPVGRPLYNGHRAIWLQQFDLATKQLVGPRSVIVNGGTDLSQHPIWIEGPHLFKVNGRYYLICAQGGTGDQHSEVVFRSDSVFGPYVSDPDNPILTQRQLDPNRPFPITSTGHADFVQTQNGEWWAVFLGTRPYTDDTYNTGRETFLMPVHWQNGWPVITPDDEVVPWVHTRPGLPAQPPAPVPTSGNFTVRDDFSEHALPPYWEFIRTPRSREYDLTSKPGWLTLHARPVELGSRGQPTFIGRRQQHARATVTTAMDYRPAKPGDEAGIVAYQNDRYFYLLGVTLEDGRPVIRLEQRAGRQTPADSAIIASAPLRQSGNGPLYLRIDADGGTYAFYYGYQPDHWILLKGGVDGTILSTRVAGGFVGTMLGMYAGTAPTP